MIPNWKILILNRIEKYWILWNEKTFICRITLLPFWKYNLNEKFSSVEIFLLNISDISKWSTEINENQFIFSIFEKISLHLIFFVLVLVTSLFCLKFLLLIFFFISSPIFLSIWFSFQFQVFIEDYWFLRTSSLSILCTFPCVSRYIFYIIFCISHFRYHWSFGELLLDSFWYFNFHLQPFFLVSLYEIYNLYFSFQILVLIGLHEFIESNMI